MHARLSSYRGDTDRLVAGFRRTVEPLEEMEGFVRALFLTDRARGHAMTLTVWETEAALSNSAEWADKAREHAAHDAEATIESVTHYEVALSAEKAAMH
jgi:heme-degrading monooxygenase HmoA